MCRKITVIAIRIPNTTKPPTTLHTTMMISLVLSEKREGEGEGEGEGERSLEQAYRFSDIQ